MTGALALGSRIHEALDMYYSTGVPLLDAHRSLVEADAAKLEAQGRDVFDLEAEADLGRIMLEGYLEWVEENGIDAELETISNEEIIEMPLLDGRVILQGKIDMRVRRKADGVRLFRDFKTVAGSFTDFGANAHMNEQFMTYMMLEFAQNKEGERSEGGIFTLLKKVKRTARSTPPFYEQIEVRHNVFTMRSFWIRIHGVLNEMLAARDALDAGGDHREIVYPHATKDCKWKCTFFSICPMFDDGSAVEASIEDNFSQKDPYSYYGVEEKKGNE
jgi:rRNA maturation protein Nop10